MGPEGYGGTDNLEVMEGAVNYNRWLVRRVLEAMPVRGLSLDFGAGLGYFLREVAGGGLRVEAAENEPRHVELLEQAGFRTHRDLGGVPDSHFDGAYSLNVLEHIEDDGDVLRELARVLRPGAPLLIYVPALPMLFTAMDRKVGHVRRYRRAELRTKLARAGFHVEDIRHVDLLGVVATLIYRMVGSRHGDLDRRSVVIYDRLVFPVSRLLDVLLRGAIGKNLLARAVRRADP